MIIIIIIGVHMGKSYSLQSPGLKKSEGSPHEH